MCALDVMCHFGEYSTAKSTSADASVPQKPHDMEYVFRPLVLAREGCSLPYMFEHSLDLSNFSLSLIESSF